MELCGVLMRFLKKNIINFLLDTHFDFIKAGAEVIVTATFTTEKKKVTRQ